MKLIDLIHMNRISQRLSELGEIGKTADQGVYRLALTKEDWHAQELVAQWMREAGMMVKRDHFGNLIGRREGTNPSLPVIMLGSHIDSVPNGGKYDGTTGVIGAIEVVQAIHDAGLEISYPIEVVAFCDEEGPRFSGGFFGSKGMIGKITAADLQQKDEKGITRYEAIQDFGIDPEGMAASVRQRGDIKLYLEMHIEQGPSLQSIDRPVGIVTGIAGLTWLAVKVMGEAGHAGTVPMHLRRDPLVGAAEIIQGIERICGANPSHPTVGTVGRIKANPGGNNVIPASVEFSVDIRDIDLERRNQMVSNVKENMYEVAKKRNLEIEIEELIGIPPISCSNQVIEAMEKANTKLQLGAPRMVSGAGHDAMVMGEITDFGMIFVRCKDGISHNPKEWANPVDIRKGVQLLLETVLYFGMPTNT